MSEFNSPENSNFSPFFSIGVTTYNRPRLLKQTLDSIIAQTFRDFEVLIGNDYVQGPLSAETLGLISDPRIRFVNYPENLGEAENMNALLRMGRGRYFTWQCDDDLYAPNFLENVYASLINFNFPSCVLTSYEFIYGTSAPDGVKSRRRHGTLFTGRSFLRAYLSEKIKAMGCTGVYEKNYLKHLGGVQCLMDSPTPLYSEHLLLLQAGRLDRVAHIDEPMIRYRIHEDAWGCSAKDLSLYRQAGQNLLKKSIEILSTGELRNDFRENIECVLKFIVSEYFEKSRSCTGLMTRHAAIPFFLSLKTQLNSLRGSDLYQPAMSSWLQTGLRLAWWLVTKFNLKAAFSSAHVKISQ
jgi:glycosyltransferase involved in cell wall biosynthesis